MKKHCTPNVEKMEAWIGTDPLTEALRGKVREMIMTLVEGELEEVLAAMPYERNWIRRAIV